MIFRFRQFNIRHRDSLLKVNTDAVLLGALVQSKNTIKNVLDIGTGCGIIALMTAQKFQEAMIDAIEIDQPSHNESVFNFQNSPFSSRLKAIHVFLQDYKNANKKYDLIVSNPPYFEVPQFAKGNNTQDIKESRKKLATQHTLTFEELVHKSTTLLDEQGHFWVIIPYAAKEKFKEIALKNKLYSQKEYSIRSKPESAFIRSVLCFGFDKTIACESSEMIIYNPDGTRSNTYTEITKEYYL